MKASYSPDLPPPPPPHMCAHTKNILLGKSPLSQTANMSDYNYKTANMVNNCYKRANKNSYSYEAVNTSKYNHVKIQKHLESNRTQRYADLKADWNPGFSKEEAI